jgi:hypothetical protein
MLMPMRITSITRRVRKARTARFKFLYTAHSLRLSHMLTTPIVCIDNTVPKFDHVPNPSH